MSKFVVVVFPSKERAAEGERLLEELNSEGSITLYASTTVSKDAEGRVLQEETQAPGPRGMVLGALVGGLVGMIGGPAVAAVGAAGGALMGGWRDMLGIGVGFEFLDEVSRELRPGHWAVVSALDEEWETPLDTRMESIGGIVVRTRRDDFEDERLRGELEMARTELAQYEAELSQFGNEEKARLAKRINYAQTKLRRGIKRTESHLSHLREEKEAQIDALGDRAGDASDGRKAGKDTRIAAVRLNYERRFVKLEQALELAKEAVA